MLKVTEKNENDLRALLKEKQEAFRAFRFGVAGAKVKNVKEGMMLRRDIARILTEFRTRRAK